MIIPNLCFGRFGSVWVDLRPNFEVYLLHFENILDIMALLFVLSSLIHEISRRHIGANPFRESPLTFGNLTFP